MLGLGWTEMLVVGVMALIFIGPKDLPVVMNRIGKIIGQVKRMGNDFQREINKTTGLDEVRNLRNSITGPLKKSTDEIRKEFNAMTPTGAKPSGAIKPVDSAAESVVDEIKAKAGMAEPVVPKTADEVAKAAGFKPAGPAPSASSATFGKPSGEDAVATAPASKQSASKKSAAKKPANKTGAAKPATATKPVTAKKAVPRKAAAPKPATTAKPATVAKSAPAKAVQTKPAGTASAKPAPKKRAPAKPKTTAVAAGDE